MAWYAIVDTSTLRRSTAYRNLDDLKKAGCVSRIVRLASTDPWRISEEVASRPLCDSIVKISGRIAQRD